MIKKFMTLFNQLF